MMSGTHDAAVGDDEPKEWKLHEVNIEAQADPSHSFPAAEEAITDIGGIPYKNKSIPKKLLFAIVAALVVLVIAIPLAVVGSNSSKSALSNGKSDDGPIDKVDGVAGDKDADEDIDHTDTGKQGEILDDKDSDSDLNHTPSNQENTSDTGADTTEGRMATFDEIVEWMVKEDVSHRTDMETTGKPQHSAVEWLALHDEGNLPVPTTGTRDDFGDGYKYVVRYVMAVNYFATQGHRWDKDYRFMSKKDVCGWHNLDDFKGVFCAGQGPWQGLPFAIHMQQNGLRGQLPGKENGRLITLKTLDVRQNQLTGHIPIEVCNMKSLQKLEMSSNLLGGSIPYCLGTLEHLEEIYIQDNQLESSVPSELGNLRNLTDLFIANNMLTGNPVNTFNQLNSLQVLMASDNQFTGTIDTTFLDDNEFLYWVDISHNKFTSTSFPSHLLSHSFLNLLDLSSNNLGGSLPENIPENTRLAFFAAYDNQLTGSLPINLRNLQGLVHLDLATNKFEGPIPEELGELSNLWLLFLSENPNLEQGEIPLTFAVLSELRELSLRNTNRAGPLPDFIGDNLSKLYMLDLGSNSLTGSIPASYGKLSALDYLLLNNNPISGKLPETLANMTSLYGVFLDGTDLVGDINVFCQLPNFINLDGNQFVYADCGGTEAEIACLCAFDCQCCEGGLEGGCSQPSLANLDGNWENDFRRKQYDFSWDQKLSTEINSGLDGSGQGA